MSEYDPIIGIPIGGYRKEGAAMSDDELSKSLDTYACQLREANAKLIYAAKARIEALRGEVDLIKTLGVGAALETVAQKERAQKAEAEAEALRGEVARLRSTFNAGTVEQILKVTQDRAEKAEQEAARLKAALEAVCAIAYDHGSIAAIAHARKALAGETT